MKLEKQVITQLFVTLPTSSWAYYFPRAFLTVVIVSNIICSKTELKTYGPPCSSTISEFGSMFLLLLLRDKWVISTFLFFSQLILPLPLDLAAAAAAVDKNGLDSHISQSAVPYYCYYYTIRTAINSHGI
jgi:hypothetical protein